MPRRWRSRRLPFSNVASLVAFLLATLVSLASFAVARTTVSPWWQAPFQRPQQYRKALEEQVQWLEEQLRQVTEERMSLQQRLQSVPGMPLLDRRVAEQTTQLREQLAALQEQLEDLAQAKQALVDLLEDQERQIQTLVDKCQQAHQRGQDVQASYQLQLDQLTSQLHHQTQDQLTKLQQLMQQQIQQAQQEAKEQVWAEAKERIAKVTAQLQRQFDAELQAERLKTAQAIERQRQKMRSLAKAMALRERKLYQQQQLDLLKDQERQRTAARKLQQQRLLEEQMQQQRLLQQQQEAEQLQQQLLQRQQQQERLLQQQHERKQKQEREMVARLDNTIKIATATTDPRPKQNPQPLHKILGPFRTSKSNASDQKGSIASPVSTSSRAANWQRRVPWQPGLPPMDILGK